MIQSDGTIAAKRSGSSRTLRILPFGNAYVVTERMEVVLHGADLNRLLNEVVALMR